VEKDDSKGTSEKKDDSKEIQKHDSEKTSNSEKTSTSEKTSDGDSSDQKEEE
jgi:hypothetical protein